MKIVFVGTVEFSKEALEAQCLVADTQKAL